MVKNVRVKIYKNYSSSVDHSDLDVYISESNVSDYEGNINMKLTDVNQFIELEGGSSSGCPDLFGNINYKSHKIDFQACNPAFDPTWFSLRGKDGKTWPHDFNNENDTWKPLIDEVNFFIKRLPDGDGCKLFEVYVG
jgi:hypothetical protein